MKQSHWSWEFLTKGARNWIRSSLYPSIYGEDEEAFEIWNKRGRCTGRENHTISTVIRRPESVITSGSMVLVPCGPMF